MKNHRTGRHLLTITVLLLGATSVAAESPTVHIEYQARVNETGGLRYVLAEGTMSGTVRGDATYTVPVQIHYPVEGGNGTAILELTNSALLFFHLRARGDRVGDHRSDADDIDELESMLVNFGWAGAREYLLRNGFTHMAIQYSKAVTDFMGDTPPEGRTRRRLCYGRIERASDGYEIVRDAARWLAAAGALTGDAPPVSPHDHVIAYGLSGTGYFLRDYLTRGENAGGEIDGFFVHAAGSKCLAPIDDTADCPEGAICIGSPRFSHWFTCPGPPPTNGAKVLAVDAQSDLEFNDGALAREGAVDDPDYVRWEVAGAPHVPVFAMDLTRLGAPQQNPMDWSPIWRSAFHYLDRWVKHGTAPPTAPPIEGRMVATEDGEAWETALDADGNALGGIRLPPIEAPKGVYTGFDYSWLDPAVSKGHRFAMVFAYGGRFERFSEETLTERYPTEADYRESFEAAARRAFDAGYILEEDLRRYTADTPHDRFFNSAGVQIRYIDVGPRDGEPVVLVHGGASSIESQWGETGMIDALDDDYRVIALDCRGHGKSDKPHDAEAYGNEMVLDVVRLLDHLEIEKAHIVGYSMGGRIAYKLVADHPERLISAMPCGTDGEGMSDEMRVVLDGAATAIEETGIDRTILDRFNTDGSLTSDEIDRLTEQLVAANDPRAIAAVMRSFSEFGPDRARLEANAVPCLDVIGEHDPNRVALDRTAQYMANLEIHVIDGASHLTTFRDPEFVAAIKDFLGEHVPADDRYFDSDGVRIRYIDVGAPDGEPVVLIHGFTQRIETAWVDTGVVDTLDDDYRVIALDWRGHGMSDTPHDPALYGPPAAEDVIRLLDHLELDKAHIVGYSMGGHITFRLLADHPDRILSAMPCSDPGVHVPEGLSAVSERTVQTLKASGSIRPLVDYFATPGSLTEEQARAIVEAQRDSNDVDALAAILSRYRALDADPAKLAVSRVPCLAIIGEHDPFRDGALETATEMANLDVRVIRGHDHITVLQSPEFTEAVKEFLAAQDQTSDRFFDSDGVRIRYIDVGPCDGEAIVLVHGGFDSVEGSWLGTGVIDALDDECRVIAPDLRGHGRSDKPRDPAQYGAEMAADVIRLLDHLGIERAHVVGYSMGGHIVFKLVADHPERLRSAMPCGDGGRPATGAFAEALRRTVGTLEASGSIRPVLDYFVTPGSMSAEEVAAIDAALRDANDSAALAAMLRNWQGMDADPAKLAASRVPCLAVIGELDPLRADLEATAERMPNLRVEIMRGHDHMTAFRDPGIADTIKTFVGAHSLVEGRSGAGSR